MKTALNSLSKNKDFYNWEQKDQVEFKLNLQSFLIQPIQRIPRYQLLVNEILKHTDPEHKDYTDLQIPPQMIKKVATDVNTVLINAKQNVILVSLNKKLSNVDLIKPHRKYVCEGVLMKKSTKKDQARLFYLFSDLLIIASKDISIYTLAPLNIQDKDAIKCNICHQPFNMRKRRHHCRKCGEYICGECQKHKTVLKARQMGGKVCVCNNCFIEVKDEEEQELIENNQKNKNQNQNQLKKKIYNISKLLNKKKKYYKH
ncbi:faciogenital dysplasia protein [Anaeramoeba flamelloides]|uniref:Faciogenital dysplasia protein n=1 Tax=Anaeramoeba flamelloides TaxID=1746091 RepID=A0AAV7ZZS0_9EUKA|nr:faciogenital dysplasia protein [Anaeramoeba flamelloides]